MRVLHVLDHSVPLHSGYSFRTRSILREQRALGWETCHLTGPRQGPAPEVEHVDGLDFYRTPASRPARRGGAMLDAVATVAALSRRLDGVVRELRPDLLHAHSPALNGLASLRVARRHRLPLVYEVRAFWEDAAVDHGTTREGSPRYRLTRALESHVLRRADAVTCICEGLRADIVARGVDPERITMIPNAVDANRFAYRVPRDEALAHRLGLKYAVVIGFLGSFYGYEGLDLLLDALPMIRRAHPDVQALLVGGGPQAQRLQAQAVAAGLDAAVTFTGRVAHEAVDRYYSLVDICIYPRRSMRLTELVTPLKPLEAMAQGKLVVASAVGGHRELIRDGVTGVLFRAGSAEALATAVLELLEHGDVGEAMRAAGRRFVETERSWAASVARYRKVYGSLSPKVVGGEVRAAGERVA
ncbi:MAG: glycosyltransferase, exosortase A system-associated [Nitrococcus sp.]|nr:glycosyltransferase, exosortase A system-associated [Nitrococcus sp.]